MLYINTDAIEAVNNGTDIPKTIKVKDQKAVKLRYVSTDAWRGYWEATPFKKYGWQPVESSWVTGDWSDAPEGHDETSVEEKLHKYAKEQIRKGYDVLAVFTPTSNVFSTSYDVFTKEAIR